MVKKNFKLMALVLATALTLGLAGCGTPPNTPAGNSVAPPEGPNPITLKVGSQDTATSPAAKLLEEFKTGVEEKSGGEITVDIYYSGTLGSLNDMIEGVSMGTIDMVTAGIGAFQSYCDNMMIYDNYMVSNADEFLAVWNSEVGKQVLEQLRDESGINILAYNLGGVGQVDFWSKRDYTSIADLKNANLRTNGTKTTNLACAAIGAVGVGVSNAEQYNAFQTGLIDAMCLDTDNMFELGYMEKGMYQGDIIQNFLASAFAISENSWKKLSGKQQQILIDCAGIYADHSVQMYQEKLDKAAERMEEYGIVKCSISESDRKQIDQMVHTALQDYYAEFCDQDVLEQVNQLLADRQAG